MTVIVGVVGQEEVYLGADRQYGVGYYIKQTGASKIVSFPHGLIASSGTAGYLNAQKQEELPKPQSPEDSVDFLYENYISKLKKVLVIDKDIGFAALIVWNNKLFQLDGSWGLSQILDSSAIGSGGEVALGAMYDEPRNLDTVKKALRAAEYHLSNVGGPFDIYSVHNGIQTANLGVKL